jgi:Putative adhesin
MRNFASLTAVAALALGATLGPRPAGAQERETDRDAFTWQGRIAPGRWLRVKNMNGPITVEAASGDQAEVRATKHWRHGDPKEVRIEVQKVGADGGDILICALWSEDSSCSERSYRSNTSGWRRNDTEVDFVVRLPRGVRVAVSTVNGGVAVDGASSEVDASTVNGGIEAATDGGPVNANTVNGDIRVRMAQLGNDEDLSYSTVNGSVTVQLPDTLDADVEMTTVNGSLSADYPLTMQGRISPRRIRATIGRGGRRMEFKTVNGDVRLVKRS